MNENSAILRDYQVPVILTADDVVVLLVAIERVQGLLQDGGRVGPMLDRVRTKLRLAARARGLTEGVE